MLAPERLTQRFERLGVDETDGTSACRVSSATAAVVRSLTRLGIPGVPGVQRAVGAAEHIHEEHERILTDAVSDGAIRLGALAKAAGVDA